MALATLSVDLVANLARFEADLGRAARAAESTAQRVNRTFSGTGAVFAGNLLASAVTEAARQIAGLVPSLVAGVAKLQDLEEKTGASAVALGSMQTAADVAGISIDDLAGFMVRLTGTLSKTISETKGAGAALKALDLDLASFRELAPEQQFQQLAERLSQFEDGSAKTAVAIALLGKSGADALPFLKALAETGASQIKLSAEQIRLADDLADRNAKLRSELRQAAQVAALQFLPALNALAGELLKAVGATDDLGKSAGAIGSNTGIRTFAQNAVIALATVVEAAVGAVKAVRAIGGSFEVVAADIKALAALATTSPAELGDTFLRDANTPLRRTLDERARIVEQANQRYAALVNEGGTQISDALRKQFSDQNLGLTGERLGALNDPRSTLFQAGGKPKLKFSGVRDEEDAKRLREAEQVREAILRNALRVIDDLFGQERERIAFQREFLDAQYDGGIVSLRAYWSQRIELTRRSAESEAAEAESRAARLRAELPRISDPSARVRAEGEIGEAEAKAASARRRYAQQAQIDSLAQQRAIDDLASKVREFAAEMLELQGDAAGAARVRADAAIEKARSSAAALGLSPAQVGSYERAVQANLALADAQRDVASISERSAIAEERFLIAAQARGATTAETEEGLRAIRSASLGQLRELLAQTEALAAAAPPDSPTAQFLQQLRLLVDRAAAGVDPAIERLRELGNEAGRTIASGFEDAIVEGRGLSDVLKQLDRDLTRIVIRRVATEPLSEAIGGFINQATGAVSGQGQGAAATGIAGALVGQGGTAAATSAIASLAGPAAAASTSLSAIAGPATAAGTSLAPISGAAGALLGAFAEVVIGAKAAASALAEVAATKTASAAAGAFDSGGYTGDGGKHQPAGIVHAGEYVIRREVVGESGVRPMLDKLNRYGLRGYADGGLVKPLIIARPSVVPVRSERQPAARVFEQHISIAAPAGGMSRETQTQLAARIATISRRAFARVS